MNKQSAVCFFLIDSSFFFTSSVYMLVFMGLQTAFNWRYAVITMVIIGQMSLAKSAPKAVVLRVRSLSLVMIYES